MVRANRDGALNAAAVYVADPRRNVQSHLESTFFLERGSKIPGVRRWVRRHPGRRLGGSIQVDAAAAGAGVGMRLTPACASIVVLVAGALVGRMPMSLGCSGARLSAHAAETAGAARAANGPRAEPTSSDPWHPPRGTPGFGTGARNSRCESPTRTGPAIAATG